MFQETETLQSTVRTKLYTRLVNYFKVSMNQTKFKVYKKILKEVVEKYDGVEDFMELKT